MIYFRKIRWKNLLSTGNKFTEISLDKNQTTLIHGSNGAGKSTLLDALAYSLYKKAFRNINIPNLLNTVNQKDCLVEVEFDVGARSYLVRRGIKPNIFEVYVDGELIPQSANVFDYQENLEKNILRMNYKTFSQIVVLGSANFVPFMLLPAQSRREIIENLLDIDVFSRMNTILKADQKRNDDLLNEITQKSKLISSRISLMEKHIKEMESNNESQINDIQNNIREVQQLLDDVETRDAERKAELADLEQLRQVSSDKLRTNIAKHKEAKRQLDNRQKKLLESLTEFDSIESCPSCQQSITEDARQNIRSKKNDTLSKIEKAREEITRKVQTFEDDLMNALELEGKIIAKQKELVQLGNEKSQHLYSIRTLTGQLESLQRARTEIDTTELEKHKTALVRLTTRKNAALEESDLMNTAASLLKDGGIKSMIIRQYIPVMNKLINKYLEQMDFFCLFEIDETFKETMKAVYKDEMVYTSLSQGERMRVDIALLFTWREIAKMRNAALTNILILDEIMDSSLDGNGTEEFLKIIQTISQSSNIIIISHKSDQIADKFERSIRFEKRSNFSQIVGVE